MSLLIYKKEKMIKLLKYINAIIFLVYVSEANAQTADLQLFNQLNDVDWQTSFTASKTDWTGDWFLDGERGYVKNTPEGMVFTAGPIRGDNGSHNVLWTKKEFEGDVKIEFDYTRLDDINYAVNILYILATGIGEAPYHKDITRWSHLRVVPYMNRYFRHMNLLHISYAAYPLKDDPQADYVRARRYPVPPGGNFGRDTRLTPDYSDTGLFKPGITYHFTVIKRGGNLMLRVENKAEEIDKFFHWNTSNFDPVTEGRIGIRHMYTRAARYANFTVYTLK